MTEIVKEVAHRMDCSQNDAREVLSHFADVIAERLAVGGEASYKPLGTFVALKNKSNRIIVLYRPSRTLMRNISNGDPRRLGSDD